MPTTPTLGLPYPVSTDTADVPRDMQALALAIDGQMSFMPVGALILWCLANPPAGNNPNGKAAWLICNGQLVAAADYPKLAALLGQAGGNVTIPDLKGRTAFGATATVPLLTAGGEATHLLTLAELPAHLHAAGTLTDPATVSGTESVDHRHAGTPGYVAVSPGTSAFVNVRGGSTAGYITPGLAEAGTGSFSAATWTGGRDAAHTHTTPSHAITGSTANAGGGAAMNNLPPYLSVNFVMRAA